MNNQFLVEHISSYYNRSVEEFAHYLADKYITDSKQKEIFLESGVWLKVRLNYIAGLLLSNRGKEIFSPKEIRDIIREEIIPTLTEISDAQLSGTILTSDVHINAVSPKWNNGYPCLEQIGRGKYRFIGFNEYSNG